MIVTRYLALFILCCSMFLSVSASVNCDASFTYQSQTNSSYHFSANQQQLSGYTYFNTWRINNGTPSYNNYLNHYFGVSGVYNICHTIAIQDSAGVVLCTDSVCVPVQVTISSSCFPYFYIYYTITGGLSVSFTNSLVNYTNSTLLWTFGDGTSLAGVAAPVHQYGSYNRYPVRLYITDTVAHCTDSASTAVYLDTMDICDALYSDFTATQIAYNGTDVALAPRPNSYFQTVQWTFGDGTTSTQDSVIHHFPGYSTYNVCLTLTDTIFGCSANSCYDVTIVPCDLHWQEINVSTNGNIVSFNASGIENNGVTPTYYSWYFNDGTPAITLLSGNHTYNTTGPHVICFDAGIPGCTDFTVCDTINIQCALSANFQSTELNSTTEQFTGGSLNYTGLKYRWAFGDGATGINNNPIHVYTQPGYYNVCMFVTDTINGCTDTTCRPVEAAVWTDTICGHVFDDANLNGIQDSGDVPVSNADIDINGYSYYSNITLNASTDSNGFYTLPLPANSNINVMLNYSPPHYYTLPYGVWNQYYQYFTSSNTSQCGFDFGISTHSARVIGTVYADFNRDSVYDAHDGLLANQLVKIGNQSVITTLNGGFNTYVPLGALLLTANNGGYYSNYPVWPQNIPLNITTTGASYGNNNFGIGIDTNTLDVAIDLFPTGPVSPLSPPGYVMLVSNLSRPRAYYQASIVSDTALSFNQDIHTGFTSTNSLSHTTSWLDNLPGLTQKMYNAHYSLSNAAVINQDIYSTASLEIMLGTDINTQNDTSLCHQIVVSSFDPNSKTSNQSGVGDQGYINGNQILDYVIAFQNTGTSTAFNIVVSDVISPNLDINSFRFLGASRNCDVRLTGDTLYFRFSQIMLPYTTGNDTGSHGWVAFSIMPKPNLPALTQITNTAAIYFDHNTPVFTNTTLHTIAGPEAINDVFNDGKLTIAPNPFSDQTVVELKGVPDADYRYVVTDITGKQTAAGTLKANTPLVMPRNGMESGMYIITIYNNTSIADRAKIIAY